MIQVVPSERDSGVLCGGSKGHIHLLPIVQPDPGCGVITRASDSHRLLPGDHGWPPDHPDMWGIFYAAGPRIPASAVTGPVRVVDVYPLMLAILGLEAPGATDGDPRVLASRLLPESE